MLALVLSALLPLLPPDQAPAQLPTPGTAQPRILATRPFSRLFTVPVLPPVDGFKVVVLDPPRSGVKKRIVCGMTVIVVDGSSDPKMALAPDRWKDVDPRMPRVPKPMCGSR
jgi:hypothetical protein